MDLGKYRAVFFDVDGVLRHGAVVIDGAAQTINSLRQRGIKVGVITNNSGSPATNIAHKLHALGIRFFPHEIISAVSVTATWISRQGPEKTAYVLGHKGVESELVNHGVRVVSEPQQEGYACDYLVVGACRHISYELLTQALRVGLQGAQFVAINIDRTFPGTDGLYPAAGAMVGAVSAMLGRQPDIVIGKPAPYLGELALERFGVTARESLMVGDTLDTDIAMGQALGMDTALVLTGNDTEPDSGSAINPTYILDSVADLSRR